MPTLILTKNHVVLDELRKENKVEDTLFITSCIKQAREFSKLFDPCHIYIGSDSQSEDNLTELKKWPTMLQRKMVFLPMRAVKRGKVATQSGN